MPQPSANEQYMLELVNAERAKVGAQPLAFDSPLLAAGETHSQWMIAADVFSHTGAGGSSATDRMKAAGYAFDGTWASGENIAWASLRGDPGTKDEVELLHQNLMNSPGHKANILNANFREIGIGFETGDYQGYQSAFVTQNFARSGSGSQLTGVAFDDKDGDRFYDPGEGLGGIAVRAVASDGRAYSTTTMDAGGYQLDLAPGTYTVTFSGGGVAATTKTVTVGSTNVKLDLVDPQLSGGTTPTAPAPTVPAPTPVATGKTINGTSAANSLTGGTGADTIYGNGGNDKLYGKGGNDRLDGGTGDDYLSGSSGNDTLLGRAGRDKLVGGSGDDRLYGGADADTFVFAGSWGKDKVYDFQNGLDHFDLRGNGLTYSSLKIGRADADLDGVADDVVVQALGQSIGILNTALSAIDRSDFYL